MSAALVAGSGVVRSFVVIVCPEPVGPSLAAGVCLGALLGLLAAASSGLALAMAAASSFSIRNFSFCILVLSSSSKEAKRALAATAFACASAAALLKISQCWDRRELVR